MLILQVPTDPRYRDISSEDVSGNIGQEAVPENDSCKVEIETFPSFLYSSTFAQCQDDLGQIPKIQDAILHQ